MKLIDIWPTLGQGYKNDGPIKRLSRKPTTSSRGVSQLNKYFKRYTHVLSAWQQERNLRKK